MDKEYNGSFYDAQVNTSLQSAQQMVPYIFEIIKPESIIDVGCGLGTWLSVFRQLGAKEIKGIDGSWVDQSRLLIPSECFSSLDLKEISQLEIDKKFDIAMSLEVAEHLNESEAESLVKSLTNMSDVVLFSGAIPYQGGTHHINEQWHSYWIDLFRKNGFEVLDCLRGKFWNNPKVSYFYAQNAFIFYNENKVDRPGFEIPLMPFNCVHPQRYSQLAEFVWVDTSSLMLELVNRFKKATIGRIINRLKRKDFM
ncbi:class I SAM-dependent methyltransferase [Pseudodesulfovibrio methanolicus]|uniref:Methyltransferase domain-containing protein n=1 Tax=Pseudodesulfovibrio methanolicus TaxID=3126690 RepID=A0ABZ2ITA3_9BACT